MKGANFVRTEIFDSNGKFFAVLSLGIALRFVMMALGNTYDFESYCLVGEIVNSGGNVYAATSRYNYAPIFFTILGIFHQVALCFANPRFVYRILIVGLLTCADLSIAKFVSRKSGRFWGIVFFLNPVSLIVTGYHNQFDNIAIAMALWGTFCLEKVCSKREVTFYDFVGVALLSCSLATKHVFFAFPIWILFNTHIASNKKLIYAFVPPLIFLMSFAPYVKDGWDGILHNVFLYASNNNFPLLFANLIGYFRSIPEYVSRYFTSIFFVFMIAAGYVFRTETLVKSILVYTIALVCFSSAIGLQYIAIPCAALVIFFGRNSFVYYVAGVSLYFCGFLESRFNFPLKGVTQSRMNSIELVYVIIAWILLCYLGLIFIRRNNSHAASFSQTQ